MGFYRIRLLDKHGRLTHSSLFTCQSDESACALASTMLEAGARADVWLDRRKIGSVGAWQPSPLTACATDRNDVMTYRPPSRADLPRRDMAGRSIPHPAADGFRDQPRHARPRVDAAACAAAG